MPTIAQVKGWAEFQHYRDRSPPWIKLHRKLLDNFEFARLPLASKALAPLLWLLAAESNDGSVRVDYDWIAFRLHITEAEAEAGVSPLIDSGFLVIASGVLAPRKRIASLEREGEAEGEGKKQPLARQAARFVEFWAVYPLKKGRKDAEVKWRLRGLDAIADRIIADVKERALHDRQWKAGYVPHGSTYVNGAGWEDEIEYARGSAPPPTTTGSSPKIEDNPQRKLDAMRAYFDQQVEYGYMTRATADEKLKPYKEAAREPALFKDS